MKDLLQMSRGAMEMFESTQKRLVKRLLADPALSQRIERLANIPGVGEVTALTWALEVASRSLSEVLPRPSRRELIEKVS